MEDIKKLLILNDETSAICSSSDDDESDNDELSMWNFEKQIAQPSVTSTNTNGVKNTTVIKRNGEERLPTRRPDPNVYNRNALLARENRRKKKMYLEMIENELQDARKANRALMKALKRQMKISRRLEEEKRNFQALIGNRSEILGLVSALNLRKISPESDKSPFSTSSSLSFDNTYSFTEDYAATSSISYNSSSPHPLDIHFENPSDGSVTVENENSSNDFSSFDFCTFPDFFTDLEDVKSCGLPTTTSWDDLWNNHGYNGASNDILQPIPPAPPLEDTLQIVNNDHCYMAANTTTSFYQQYELSSTSPRSESSVDLDVGTDSDPAGICLHIADSKVSAEFCSTCHWTLTSGTPPLQLLNDDSLL